jgi:ATP-binding cassette, subfamily B, bacterial
VKRFWKEKIKKFSSFVNKKPHTKFRQIVTAHLASEKWNFAFAVFCTLSLAAADLLKPWTLKIIIDNVLLSKPLPEFLSFLSGIFDLEKTLSVILIASTVVVISAIKGVSTYSQVYITSRIGYRLAHKLRRELFAHLQRLSLSFHNRAETGELLTKVTADTNNLRDTFSEFALQFVTELITLLGMLVIMFLVNWRLSLIVLATFPILAAISVYRFHAIRESARAQRTAEGKIAAKVHEVLNSIQVVQAFGRERYEERRFETQSEATLAESIRTARLEAASSRAVDIVSAIGLFVLLVFGSLQALDGKITPGSLLVFAAYMTSLNAPIRALAKLSAKISRSMVSANRIADILEVQPEIEDKPGAIEAKNLSGFIRFQNVSFDYGDSRQILKDISFNVPAGKKVALLGVSGAGKSTIISLILRFYDARAGEILIDGRNIKDYKRESLRGEIGIVLQDTILFGASVRENIAYGKENATDDEIILAAKAANAHEFITKLENGYDTILGERGGTLSGGQRQRLAIARAFIRNVPILILDEPMTGLDAESESSVRDAMRRLMQDKTCLLITHDLQNAAEADLILLLDDGRIAEQGTHAALMEKSRRYQSLFLHKNKTIEATNAIN